MSQRGLALVTRLRFAAAPSRHLQALRRSSFRGGGLRRRWPLLGSTGGRTGHHPPNPVVGLRFSWRPEAANELVVRG